MPLHLSLRNATQTSNTARQKEKALWYAQLPWATYLLICQGGVDVRHDDLGIGDNEHCVAIRSAKLVVSYLHVAVKVHGAIM